MDAASGRVRPADLARLQVLRKRREDEARRIVRAGLQARESAEARAREAVVAAEVKEAERDEAERAIQAKLGTGAPISLMSMMEARLRIAAWAEQVAEARAEVERRETSVEALSTALAQARARLAARMGEARRWDRVRSRILLKRRTMEERAEEANAEDDTFDRLGAARSHS